MIPPASAEDETLGSEADRFGTQEHFDALWDFLTAWHVRSPEFHPAVRRQLPKGKWAFPPLASAVQQAEAAGHSVSRVLNETYPAVFPDWFQDRLKDLEGLDAADGNGVGRSDEHDFRVEYPWLFRGRSQVPKIGDYRILSHVGAGGMAVVFKAFNDIKTERGERRRAIKVVPPNSKIPDAAERFDREVRKLLLLGHPNIVKALECPVVEAGARRIDYLVMEYVYGPSLDDLICHHRLRNRPVPAALAVDLLKQLAEGLDHMRSKDDRLVHRDLKPTNILLQRCRRHTSRPNRWEAKIADFGLALGEDDPRLSDAGVIAGTAPYTADPSAVELNTLLDECIAAGAEISDLEERERLRAISRELANKVFEKTNRIPSATIRAPRVPAPPRYVGFTFDRGLRYRYTPVATIVLLTMLVLAYAGALTWRILSRPVDGQLKTDLTKAQSDLQRTQTVGRGLRQSLWDVLESVPVEKQNELATKNCTDFIRTCRIEQGPYAGTFRMTAADANDIWVAPARASLAALALMATHKQAVNPVVKEADYRYVRLWLDWYAENQDSSGVIPNYRGKVSDSSITPEQKVGYAKDTERDPDAAANFLLALDRCYEKLDPPPSEKVRQAARNAAHAIQKRSEPQQATPDGAATVVSLLTGVTECGGAVAAARFFDRVGEPAEAKLAATCAKRIGSRLKDFLQPLREGRQVFAVLFQNGKFGLNETKGDESQNVFASLCGLAWVRSDNQEPWKMLTSENLLAEDEADPFNRAPWSPVEAWYAAAMKVGSDQERRRWRERTLRAAIGYRQASAYVDRPAITLLTLLEGPSWRPGVAEAEALVIRE